MHSKKTNPSHTSRSTRLAQILGPVPHTWHEWIGALLGWGLGVVALAVLFLIVYWVSYMILALVFL